MGFFLGGFLQSLHRLSFSIVSMTLVCCWSSF